MHRHTRAYLVTGTKVFLWVALFLKRFRISRQKKTDFCWRPRELSRKLVVLNLNWAHNSASFPYSPLPSSPHFSHPTSCLTPVSPPPPPLCSGWLSEGPPSPLNSYSSTLQRSNFELLPAMKYLLHRRDIFSQCWSRAWYKGATWKIERIWKEERSSLKLKSSNRKGTWLLC